MSDEVVIRCRLNGPLVVTGPVRVVDHEQQPFDISARENVALCRCGASDRRPFCDGQHRKIDFRADDLVADQPSTEQKTPPTVRP